MFSVLTITLDSFLPSIVPPSCYSLAEYNHYFISNSSSLKFDEYSL
nr:ribosomal protein S2B [Zea mays]